MQKILVFGFVISGFCFSACANDRLITIDSTPQGADVIADGKKIGVTPIEIMPDEVFPPHWIGSSYIVKGKLEFVKKDCEPFSMVVDDYVLSKPVLKELYCDQKSGELPTTAEKPAISAGQTVDTSIEQRLESLKALHDKGLITDKEYQTQRQRILNEL